MTCPICSTPYRKYKSESGRWLYERGCTCKRMATPKHQLTEVTRTGKAPRCQ